MATQCILPKILDAKQKKAYTTAIFSISKSYVRLCVIFEIILPNIIYNIIYIIIGNMLKNISISSTY